jgi:RHS repeat-associated protein
MISRVALPNNGQTYRFGFNGKENDNGVKGLGNQQDYGMRFYDPRVGRFLSVDPLTKGYPELTPYQYGSNNPVQNIDLDGLEGLAGNMGSPGKYHIPGDANDDGHYSKQELKQGAVVMGLTGLVTVDALVTKGALTKTFGNAMMVWGGMNVYEYTNRNNNQHDPQIRAENDKKAKGAAIDLAVGYGIGKTASVLTKLIGAGGKVVYKYFASTSIRFSQSSVNGLEEIAKSMQENGWKGDPIDIVKMEDNIYTTVDNTKLLAAQKVGIDVKATAHDFSEPIPEEMAKRFAAKDGTLPKTWGEAVKNRVGNQNKSFRTNTNGSFVQPKAKD